MSPHRKPMSVGLKLHACLLLLGFTDEQIAAGIEFDHQPALALRFFNEATGKLEPDSSDPHFIRPMTKAAHRTKTSGRVGEKRTTSAGSDQHAIAKANRMEADRQRRAADRTLAEAARIAAADDAGVNAPRSGYPSRPKRRMASRGFPKKPKPKRTK